MSSIWLTSMCYCNPNLQYTGCSWEDMHLKQPANTLAYVTYIYTFYEYIYILYIVYIGRTDRCTLHRRQTNAGGFFTRTEYTQYQQRGNRELRRPYTDMGYTVEFFPGNFKQICVSPSIRQPYTHRERVRVLIYSHVRTYAHSFTCFSMEGTFFCLIQVQFLFYISFVGRTCRAAAAGFELTHKQACTQSNLYMITNHG